MNIVFFGRIFKMIHELLIYHHFIENHWKIKEKCNNGILDHKPQWRYDTHPVENPNVTRSLSLDLHVFLSNFYFPWFFKASIYKDTE